jgi:PCI domain.
MAAKESALGAIRDPVTLFTEQRTILSLPPIATLQDKDIYTLLEIFQQGKLEDFQSFLKTHPQTLSKNNLSEQDAIRHMRLLSLCSLATEHEEIPYNAIATTLQVDQSEVENWVIDAVSSGLLSAKMDQLQHVVMVERCVVRRFGMEQWKVLQQRLDVWKKNVKSVLEGLKQSQHSQD